MNNQITLTGFQAPEHHEKEFLASIEADLRTTIESAGGDSQLMTISVTSGYTAVMFSKLTAFRLRMRGKQNYISLLEIFSDLVPDEYPTKKVKGDGKYFRLLITDAYPLEDYSDFLVRVVGETVNRYPKEWDCCSRYLACSDAKTCVHPDKAIALGCGYRKILSDGRIFYGKNRNI